MIDEDAPSAYSRQVGERLRVIRKQKRLSLQEVEAQSEPGVQGVGPRCLRARRAGPVGAAARSTGHVLRGAGRAAVAPRGVGLRGQRRRSKHRCIKKLAIDVVKLVQLKGAPFEMLSRYLRLIQVQRQDFNGRVITVRGDDVRAIASMLDVPVDQVGARLAALDLLFKPA